MSTENGDDVLSRSSVSSLIDEIVALLQEERWEEAIRRIRHDVPETLTLEESFRRLGGIVMGAACYKESVPLELYQAVIETTGSEAAMYQDAGLRTPLAMVLMYLDRTDIVRFLVQAAPASLDTSDQGGLRPIDILTQKILMKEEVLRYLKKAKQQHRNSNTQALTRDEAVRQDQQQQRQIETETRLLQECWECARLLCLCHGGKLESNPTLPLLHACCLDHRHIPLSLMQRALRTNLDQLELQDDAEGNTPLHVVASIPVQAAVDNNNSDSDDEEEEEQDEENDLLEDICKRHPSAAGKMNQQNQYPLDLAILAGRNWRSGCGCLIKQYPPALLHCIVPGGEKPFLRLLLLFKSDEESIGNVVFQLLRAAPDILES